VHTLPKRALCAGCARPPVVCVCAHVTPLRTRTRVLILQHPRERHVPINTVRLARLSLPDAILRRAVDFESDQVVVDALSGADGGPPPYLLFPGPNAVDLAVARPPGPITLVVLDGTWWQAGKLLRRNPRLAALPQLRLAPSAPSRYRIRREPHDHCVATIEAIALALRSLEGEGETEGARFDDARVAALLAPFDAMVEHQLAFRERVQDARHLRAARARGPRPARGPRIPGLEALRAAGERLVVVHGEANAWPVRVPGHPPPEIVQWLAWRPATDETFSAVVKPRGPLAPSAAVQLGLDAATLAAGEAWPAFRARWEAFVRDDDVLCGWGHFPTGTLEREAIRVPAPRLDLRVAANAWLGSRVGTAEGCARKLEDDGRVGQAAAPFAPGRGGVRMDALRRIVGALLDPRLGPLLDAPVAVFAQPGASP
jgi:DTW domain-containing protein YfiP